MTSNCKLTREEICKLPVKHVPVILSLRCPDIDYPSRRRYLAPGESVKGNCSVHFRSTADVESLFVRFIGTSTTTIGGQSETHVIVSDVIELLNPKENGIPSLLVLIGTTIKDDFEFKFPHSPICCADTGQPHKTCVSPITDFNHIVLSTGHIGVVKYQVDLVAKIVGMEERIETFLVNYENEAGKGQTVIQSQPINLHMKHDKSTDRTRIGKEYQFKFRVLYVRPEYYMAHRDVIPTILLMADSLPPGSQSDYFFLHSSSFKFEESLTMTTGKKKSTLHKTYVLTPATKPLRINISDFKPASSLSTSKTQIEGRISGKFCCDISSFFGPFKSDGASFFGGSVQTCNISSVGKMLIRLNFANRKESILTKTAVLDHESPIARR